MIACCSCQTAQQQQQDIQNLNRLEGASFHAELPFLGNSKKKLWYLFLVISVMGEAQTLLCDVPGQASFLLNRN